MSAGVGEHLTTEVVVAGGGLAGLSMACALATAGVPTVCIDRDDPRRHRQEGFDIRTTALALCGQRVLVGAGVWPHLEADAQPILDIRVADHDSPIHVHYDHKAVGTDPFGWVLDNHALRLGLFARVPELPALTHLAPAGIARVERDAAGITAHLDDGRQVRGRLIIGADGRGSLVRQTAGIGVTRRAYNQTAIICNIRLEYPHNGLAVEHFRPQGPFAVLPLTRDRASIIWSERGDLAPKYMALPDDLFRDEIQDRVGEWAGRVELDTGRAAWPLAIMLADRFIDHRIALIGEAMHAIHPIAGQGLNLSLRDIGALAEVIVDQVRVGLDPGAPDVLERYQRWRRFDTQLLAGVCHGLVHLFSNDIRPLRLARNLGFAAVERMPQMKGFFMRHAMGVTGMLPRLIRGEAL